ncbi:MAG: hypothetical protein Q9M15_01995 [Mariprofundaceae bacterium]|nr:hypothetical protein [Mariprofundaceae bacterium]
MIHAPVEIWGIEAMEGILQRMGILNHGEDLSSIQWMLGHAHITSTEIYIHVSQQCLHKCIESCHRLGQNYGR